MVATTIYDAQGIGAGRKMALAINIKSAKPKASSLRVAEEVRKKEEDHSGHKHQSAHSRKCQKEKSQRVKTGKRREV